MDYKKGFYFITISLCILVLVTLASGIPHSHKHTGQSKERESDGAYNPINSRHYKDGQHHNEFDHEAILGSIDKAEEFDQLPPEEAKRRLKVLAHKMDVDSDGFVDSKEMIDWVKKSFSLLTLEESMEQMQEEDKNQDGVVTWEEHLNVMDKDDFYSNEIETLESDRYNEEEFHAADLNKDGVLDEKEYPLFTHPEEFSEMHEVLYEQALKKKDLDKDGFIDMTEFLKADESFHEEEILAEKDRFINDYDVNKDGKLNKLEIISWLIPNNTEIAEQEVDHLFQSSDINNDGKLSISEIVDNHDVFVGSEATDYGDHLYRIKEEL